MPLLRCDPYSYAAVITGNLIRIVFVGESLMLVKTAAPPVMTNSQRHTPW